MKRNRLFILGIVTVLVALLSLTLVSGTYAKYTSSATGSDSARVAKWDVRINGKQLGKVDDPATTEVNEAFSFNVNLFETLLDSDKSTAETDVAAPGAGQDLIIAPGTSGKFEFSVYNASEVTAAVEISAVLTNTNNVPLVWTLKSKTGSAEYTAVATDGTFADLVKKINVTLGGSYSGDTLTPAQLAFNQAASAAKSFEVTWEWDFDDNGAGTPDVADTTLGLAGTATVTASFTVTATQVD